MKTINLKDYYAYISIDTYIVISDEVYESKLTNEQLHTAIATLLLTHHRQAESF